MTQNEKKNKDRRLFWILVLLLPAWILWKNIFPSTHYFFHKNVGNGLRIVEKEIHQKRYILIPAEREGLIGELKLKATFNWERAGKEASREQKQIFLAKNYEVTLYPQGNEIIDEAELKGVLFWENPSTVPNGSLLSDRQAVYVVSGGKLRPFISPEVFERLGYVWDKISKESVPPELPLGESLNLQTTHPEGAIFKGEGGKLFIFFQGKRRPVEEELLRKVWPDFSPIELEENAARFFADCSAKESVWRKKTILDCRFNLKNEVAHANVFILDIGNLEDQEIIDVRSVAVSSFFLDPKRSFVLFIEKTRGRLAAQYGFLKNL